MEKLKVDFEPAQRISRKMLVDPDGALHVFWGEGEKQKHHPFDDLDTPIRQGSNIIERYQGLVVKIGRQEVRIAGEAQQIGAWVSQLQQAVSRFLEPRELSLAEQKHIRATFGQICDNIGQVTNDAKVKAQARLRTMPSLTDSQGRKNTQVAVRTGETVVDLLKRFDDIHAKTWGVVLRTRKLVEEKMRIERIIVNVYNCLGKFLMKFQDSQAPDKKTLENIAKQAVGGKANLMAGLESIKVLPYFKRVQSREVRRLRRLPEYVEKGRVDYFHTALIGAFKKLRPVVKEREARQIKKLTVNDNGQLKR
ncbi:hypothetical protein KKD19_01200 [Patescibacteria group bacterium]|nr:hypothetical protein [Patescibacteria group bacterium]MBU4511849.1 hypothetical protein [Patescibacteria group bacterium]MCG2693475.1 hypothetical protein [Candidatus Parcubacteria bacterium]